jgi:hypothetical protein
MSVHKDCGADIQWLKRDDDPNRFLPPMEFAGQFYVKIDGVGTIANCYRPHICDPDVMEDWLNRQARLAELRGDAEAMEEIDGRQAWALAREREREKSWEIALKVDCPRCLQPKDEKCISMAQTHRKTGEMVELRNPHPDRLEHLVKEDDS